MIKFTLTCFYLCADGVVPPYQIVLRQPTLPSPAHSTYSHYLLPPSTLVNKKTLIWQQNTISLNPQAYQLMQIDNLKGIWFYKSWFCSTHWLYKLSSKLGTNRIPSCIYNNERTGNNLYCPILGESLNTYAML